MEQENKSIQSGSLLWVAQQSAGRPLVDNEDSRFALPGRGSTASVGMGPGLHIRRKWKIHSTKIDDHKKLLLLGKGE